MPALEVVGLTKTFGRRTAVQGLTFQAAAGEVVGFVGPNGAGKTTTIRMLSTMVAPTSGRFRVAGVPDTDPTGIRRRIGVLPESTGYPAGRTGREHLRFFARLHGLDAAQADRKAGELLEEFGLGDRADSLIGGWSRGMRQRLGIARTVVNDPAVVLLDEPTLGLDPSGQRRMLGLVRDLARRRGAAVLLSTHDLDVVEEVCSTVVVLDRGRVVRAGTVDDVGQQQALLLRVRVPVGDVEAARSAVERPGTTVGAAGPGILVVRTSGTAAGPHDDDAASVLRALLDAGIPVLGLESGRGRLSEAFFAATSGSPVPSGGAP